MCLLQIWITKQNKTKKKPKKETVKLFGLRKKKTKQQQQQQQQQKPEYCRFIAVSWFRCFYDDRYSGGGVVEKSNSDSVQKKTAHTIIPPLDALGPSAETEKQFLKQKKKLVGWFDSRLIDILTWLSVAAGLPVSSSRLLGHVISCRSHGCCLPNSVVMFRIFTSRSLLVFDYYRLL